MKIILERTSTRGVYKISDNNLATILLAGLLPHQEVGCVAIELIEMEGHKVVIRGKLKKRG